VSIRAAIAARSRKSPDTGYLAHSLREKYFPACTLEETKIPDGDARRRRKKEGAATAFLKNQHGRNRAATRVHR